MGTNIRPKLSYKNKYYISKERYYELSHFCMQYREWRDEIRNLDGYSKKSQGFEEPVTGGEVSDPTAMLAIRREYYQSRIDMINSCAIRATNGDPDYAAALIKAVTERLSSAEIEALGLYSVPRDSWYETYRKFFWLLSAVRK